MSAAPVVASERMFVRVARAVATAIVFVATAATFGCTPDACDAMCDAARTRFEGCLAESGLAYSAAVGYTDAADYDDWCATYAWELRQLGQADTCAERLPVFEDGTCDDYYDAWETE